jgi:hypothetical protein
LKLKIIHGLRKPDVTANLDLEVTRPKVVALVSGKHWFAERRGHSDDVIFMLAKWTIVAEREMSINTAGMENMLAGKFSNVSSNVESFTTD